jgi:hypothetical protein
MISPQRLPLFATLFAAVYAVAYVVSLQNNYALFTYHPVLNEFAFGVEAPKTGPAMYWYGWMATAGITALVAAMIISLLAGSWTKVFGTSLSWVVPVLAMMAIGYLVREFFIPKPQVSQPPELQRPSSEVE